MTKAPIYIRLKLTLPPTQRCAFSAPCELNKFNILGKKDEDKIDNTFHMPHLAAETHIRPPHISHSTLSIPHPTPEHRHVFHKKDVKNKRNEEKGNNLLYVLFRTTVIKSSFRSITFSLFGFFVGSNLLLESTELLLAEEIVTCT